MPDESIDCVVSSPPYWCYAEGHQILTTEGWKEISEVKVGDKTLSVNPANMELEWVRVVATKRWYYSGEMFEFKNNFIDLLVTPNHRMLVYYKKPLVPIKRKVRVGGKWIGSKEIGYFVEARNVKSGYVTPKTGFKWNGKEPQYFVLPELRTTYNKQEKYYSPLKIKIEDWVAFLGLWIAEGSVRGSKGGKKISYSVTIKQKEPKANKVRELLRKLPFEFNEYRQPGGLITFEIANKQLWSYLRKLGNSHTKYIPRKIKELSSKLLKIFLKWYLFGDGTIKKNGEVVCYTVSSRLKNDLQEIALKTGSNVSVHGNYLTFLKRKTVKLKETMRRVEYKGMVYGIEVEKNYTLCVKRNEKVIFSGNSLRDYNVDGQIGLEKDFNEYLDKLWQIFDEIYRVLKSTGTVWVNLGDTYYGGGKGKTNGINKAGGIGGKRFQGMSYPKKIPLSHP